MWRANPNPGVPQKISGYHASRGFLSLTDVTQITARGWEVLLTRIAGFGKKDRAA